MSEERRIWEVRLGVYATEGQAEELREQITRLLCPDPDHAPPCPIPWSVSLFGEPVLEHDEREMYTDLIDQFRIEHESRP